MKRLNLTMIYGVIGITTIVVMFLWFGHIEGFDNSNDQIVNKCPTNLIKDGDKLLLYNPKLAKVPGVNPIHFNSLDEYSRYVEWQRANKVHCPVLKLDKTLENNSATDMYSIQSISSRTYQGNGNGTSVLNHDLPSISDGIDNGVPRIQNPNYALDYYTSLKDLIALPKPPLQLNNSPTSTLSGCDSKLKPSSVSEAFTNKMINSTDLTTLTSTLEKF
uniref:Uncharacterized protein n=1 Tax=viral metagenome TaxID=1070528 RepID=A0A6C0D1R7_9ZZZZ